MASPNTPRALSGNVMKMKFMQRAAAKNAPSQPSTPSGPPSKRVRLSNGQSAPGTPSTPSDHELIQAALAEEERKREAVLARAAEQAGDSKWYLSLKDPHPEPQNKGVEVVYTSYAEIDADTDASEEEAEEGEAAAPKTFRMVFGGGVKRKPERPVYTPDESDEDDDSMDTDDADSDNPAAELIRETKRQKKREAKLAQKESEARGKSTPKRMINEDSDLSGLKTLSGGGGGSGPTQMECHTCGQKGHLMRACPNKGQSMRGSRGRGGGGGGRGGRGGGGFAGRRQSS